MATYRLNPKSKPAELLAALGEKLSEYQDRDYIYLPRKKRLIPHASARRDYVCGCGGALVTRYTPEGWRTVCSVDPGHSQGQFESQTSYHVKVAKARTEAAEVLAGLPVEIQQAIAEREEV